MRTKREIIPKMMWKPLLLTLICNGLVYNGSRLLTSHRVHYDITSRLDEQIPFVPWTVCIYLGCYLFWAVNYVIGCRQETRKAFRFLGADLAAKLVCLACFLLLPTTNIRPAIEGNSLWENLMRAVYSLDAADNLFPSIHCLTSWFCFLAVRDNDKIPGWYKAVSLLIAVSVCVSTLTTKQHVLIDVFAGVALAELSYWMADVSGFSEWYRKQMTRGENSGKDKRLHE